MSVIALFLVYPIDRQQLYQYYMSNMTLLVVCIKNVIYMVHLIRFIEDVLKITSRLHDWDYVILSMYE